MPSTSRRRALSTATLVCLAGLTGTAAPITSTAAAAPPDGTVPISLLTVNDFHGHLSNDLACTVVTARRELPNPVFLSAGDNIGGTPFESASQQDVPAMDFLSSLGLQAAAVGNHEFDRGYADLTGRVRQRAGWPYLGANVHRTGTRTPALPEHTVIRTGGVRVGVVGAVTKDTPSLVSAAGIRGIEFGDPVAAVNRVAARLRDGNAANGEADVVVALYHEGAPFGQEDGTLAEATSASPAFAAMVQRTSPKVDAVVNAHTHQLYSWAGGDGRPVLQAGFYGSHVGVLSLGWDPRTRKVVTRTATNRPVAPPTAACASDPVYARTARVVADAKAKAEQIGSRVIGSATAPITTAVKSDGGRDERMRESSLSNMIAQSYVDSLNAPGRPGGVDVGVMNPGGVRADLNRPGGEITYADAASIMPFNNTVVTTRLTGAQLVAVLEQQWQGPGSSRPFLALGLSKDVTYTYDPAAPVGHRVTSVSIAGRPLERNRVYTVASNSFLVAGGDGFTAFTQGRDTRDSGLIDQSLFVEWIRAHSPLSPSFAAHAVAVQGMPATVTPGQRLALTVSGFDLGSQGAPHNTAVQARLGTAAVGQAAATPVVEAGPPYPPRVGRAALEVTIPAGTPAGAQVLELRLAPSGTLVRVPVTVGAGGPGTPAPTGPAPTGPVPSDPGTPAPTGQPSGPPVETDLVTSPHPGRGAGALAGGAALILGAAGVAARRLRRS